MIPHAFHQNLPPHHRDDDNVPYITKFAAQKVDQILELAFSIQISESLFEETKHPPGDPIEEEQLQLQHNDDQDEVSDQAAEEDDEEDDPVLESENPHLTPSHGESLSSISKKCARLYSQINSFSGFKYGGISQEKLAQLVLHLLSLLTCTVTYQEGKAVLHHEYVGYMSYGADDVVDFPKTATLEELNDQLDHDFALPSPAREVLLIIVMNILGNKGPLRSVSNAALFLDDEDETSKRFLLIIHWKALLRMLLRTAPYLDEHKVGKPTMDSSSRQATILKRTVQLIRDARHYYDQGVWPRSERRDQTAKDVWDMVQTDVLFHSHTHACYRGSILLYLFLPSRCTPDFYLSVLPKWLEAWTNIDRCPDYDFLWLTLFCRARKHVSSDEYDWSPIRKRLLTNLHYWLQIPIGGSSMDKTFPQVANPRARQCPARLRAFVAVGAAYDENIDFMAKLAKLLVASLGTGEQIQNDTEPPVSEGTNDIQRFFLFVTPYFNPSNVGSWTLTLGAFLHYFSYELSCRVAAAASVEHLKSSHPTLVKALLRAQPGSHSKPIPAHELVKLMHVLLPLCQLALYSKSAHVGRAGEGAMVYLVQIDPIHTTPALLDFATRALDVAAVNQSHQAPSALSALTRLVQPALRSDPSILLSRLPEILQLSLLGIDGNDENKTLRTLIFYRSLTSWIPVGGNPENWPVNSETETTSLINEDGTMRLGKGLYDSLSAHRKSAAYSDAIKKLPDDSLMKQGVQEDEVTDAMQQLLLEEASSAMSDWVLEFLERIFGVLRASGEREKNGKTASGVASRHSSADVYAARNFSRILKESIGQVFAAMDDEVHKLAVKAIARFIDEETHPTAGKDTSLLCQAAAAVRVVRINGEELVKSPGLDALVPVLADGLENHSTKTLIYRLRCLAGAVRYSGLGLLGQRKTITNAITVALGSTDRHVLKTGCKLLRHTLAALSEVYPISSDFRPRVYREPGASGVHLGRSAQLHHDSIRWHIPNEECIEFARQLMQQLVMDRIDALCYKPESTNPGSRNFLQIADVNELRRCLRIIRYSIRGGSSFFLESDAVKDRSDFIPYEEAERRLLNIASGTVSFFLGVRERISKLIILLLAVIASDSLYPDGVKDYPEDHPYRKSLPLLSNDPKVCKETSDIALLLLTRRGASFRSQEARTVWKAQKQLSADLALRAEADHLVESLQRGALFGQGSLLVLYKDGECGGKSIPRRLLVARVQLFHDSLQRNASLEIPKRLRRFHVRNNSLRKVVFDVKTDLPSMMECLNDTLVGEPLSPLDAYEGIIDGLHALCCHSNTQVRASAIGVVDYAMTRFGWLVGSRVPRLLSALSLDDKNMNGKFGIPSCASLIDKLNHQGKRKRLAEAIKGVCSILSLSRATKNIMGSEKTRLSFARALCHTDRIVSLMPSEEMQKTVHYLNAVFSSFRTKFFAQPRVARNEKDWHKSCLMLVLEILSEKELDMPADNPPDTAAAHWRKLLLAAWFLVSMIDGDDLRDAVSNVGTRAWKTCFYILENEKGQPLQRVALGLFGKLILLSREFEVHELLEEKLKCPTFCKALGEAIVFDHKQDSSVGGGHSAQWSAGVEDIIRDSTRNIAPRSLFPFQRTNLSSGYFKVTHAQLVELVLTKLNRNAAAVASRNLLNFAKEMAAARPSEDQRNQQISAAEIFSGVLGSALRVADQSNCDWENVFLQHLEETVSRTPFSLSGAYVDALRYALQLSLPSSFFPLTKWLTEKISTTLWQPEADRGEEDPGDRNGNTSLGTEGFTAQSKWLFLFSAILTEMDEFRPSRASPKVGWYSFQLSGRVHSLNEADVKSSAESWMLVQDVLLPKLTNAFGHPFDSCRDHLSRCLFRICYCHRKNVRTSASRAPSRSSSYVDFLALSQGNADPGTVIVEKLATLQNVSSWSYKDRYSALNTARDFITCCVNLGEAKFEFSDFVIPLLPLAFSSLRSRLEHEGNHVEFNSAEEEAAARALEADVIKGFRYMIAEMSVTAIVSYGHEIDISRVLSAVEKACSDEIWQVRHAGAHFLRCFQGAHKFLFTKDHSKRTIEIVAGLLADDRREVSTAAVSALTGMLAATPSQEIARMVDKYISLASKSKVKRRKRGIGTDTDAVANDLVREQKRARDQRTSVNFLCATILAQPYDTPSYVPKALEAISKHSFERNAPLMVRDTVKQCCAEYKRTHMSDNWEVHRAMFTQEQLEAFEDVVSSPHYYA